MADSADLQSGRVVCPKCGAKGVGYAAHPHAFGHKDYDRASCRYCKARFKIRRGCRDGEHDFDTDRPAPDGCSLCDATVCARCYGFGTYTPERGRTPSRLVLSCRDCDGTGLADS